MMSREFEELLQFLAQTPQRVADLVAGFESEALHHKPAADAFSALEQICHLRDVEREGYALRLNRILEENNPVLGGIDGSRLAIERHYQSQNAAAALAAFADARQTSLRALHGATAQELTRTCSLEGRTGLTLAELAGLMREHDAEHLADLVALREQVLQAQQSAAVRIL